MTERSLPQSRPSDIDVFMAQPAELEHVTPAMMVAIFDNLLCANPEAESRLRGHWEARRAYWQRVAVTDAEVQREGWAAVERVMNARGVPVVDDGVRR